MFCNIQILLILSHDHGFFCILLESSFSIFHLVCCYAIRMYLKNRKKNNQVSRLAIYRTTIIHIKQTFFSWFRKPSLKLNTATSYFNFSCKQLYSPPPFFFKATMQSRLELVRSNMMESGGTEEKVEGSN